MIPRIQRRNQRTPMGRISYIGLTPQQPIQPIQRQAGGGGGGGPSIIQKDDSTTGQQEEGQGLLGAALGAKNTYDGVKAAYKGGNNLIDAAKKFPGQLENYYDKAKTGFKGLLGDSGQSGVSQVPWQGPQTPITETTMSAWDALPQSQPVNANLGSTGINPSELQFGARQANNPLALSTSSRIGPESLASLSGRASNALSRGLGIGTQEALVGTYGHTGGTQLGVGVGEAAAQTGGAAAAQTGGAAAAKAGGDASAKAASGGSKALGVAGGLLGAGLSINDMAENGVSVSNAAGLVSGMAFAAAPWLAAAGPVGWAALGVGVVASMFEW